jgi:hypothetical protein
MKALALWKKGRYDEDVFYLFLQKPKEKEPSSIYTVRTIRGCLEGLALMI